MGGKVKIQMPSGPKSTSSAAAKKIQERRATKALLADDLKKLKVKPKKFVFKAAPRWWKKESVKHAFCHPYIRSRLEKLMGTNFVSLTDREYMQKLQECILEDYAASMEKRIKEREYNEMVRVKNLVLTGRIPFDEAPASMADHPVMVIENYCKKLIAERRARMKKPKLTIPSHIYVDDTPDPPSGLTIEKGHIYRTPSEQLCHPLIYGYEDEDQDQYSYTNEEYDQFKYESPLIEQLKNCQTVEEMYELAEEIIGVLKTIEDGGVDTFSTMTGISQVSALPPTGAPTATTTTETETTATTTPAPSETASTKGD